MLGGVLATLLVVSVNTCRSDVLGTIMPVGDSITNGDWSANVLGFRDDLAALLTDAGISFSYVGDVLGEAEDPRYPGHFLPGGVIEQFYPAWFGNGWGTGEFDIGPVLDDLHPDVILIHLGTNNISSSSQIPLGPYSYDGGQTINRSFAGYTAELISYIAAHYDGFAPCTPLIVLSQIIPIESLIPQVLAFNDHLEEMALDMARGAVTGEPVHILVSDQFSPFAENPLLFTGEPGDFMHDAVHPNDSGYHVMAHSYLDALLDETPPAAVTDLTIWGQGPHTVRVWWTAPGDDSWCGTPSGVSLRFWDQPIGTGADFDAAWELVPAVLPDSPGTVQQLTTNGLPGGRTYWLALRVNDEAGNVSPVSNSPSVAIVEADSVVESFDGIPAPGVWDLGVDYYVEAGALHPVSPLPVWSLPAVCIGELQPWGAALQLPAGMPGVESERMGLLLLAQPAQVTDGFVLRCVAGNLELRRLEAGVLGVVVDTAASRFGTLEPGDCLGALPFVFEGTVMIRATRDGMPDRVLSTHLAMNGLPTPRCAGIVMQGALGWGIDGFALEGPDLWESPRPFHLLSPDSGAMLGNPPWLLWRAAADPDPWDRVTYDVLWSTDAGFPPDLTETVPCGADTGVQFPPDQFVEGRTYYWRVRATDGTGLQVNSAEQGWSFENAAGAHGPCCAVRLLPPVPNPVRGVIRVRFSAQRRSPILLGLFDMAGRSVAHTQQVADPGSGNLTWKIPDDVAPGVYVLRVTLDGVEASSTIALRR